MLVEASQSLLCQLFARAYNGGDLTAVDELVAPGGVVHTGAWGMPQTRAGLKQHIALLRAAFPDLDCSVEDEICAGDTCAARWTMRGTHQGLLLGNAPTRRPFVVGGVGFARVAHAQIANAVIVLDQMSILQQLGIVPPAGH